MTCPWLAHALEVQLCIDWQMLQYVNNMATTTCLGWTQPTVDLHPGLKEPSYSNCTVWSTWGQAELGEWPQFQPGSSGSCPRLWKDAPAANSQTEMNVRVRSSQQMVVPFILPSTLFSWHGDKRNSLGGSPQRFPIECVFLQLWERLFTTQTLFFSYINKKEKVQDIFIQLREW